MLMKRLSIKKICGRINSRKPALNLNSKNIIALGYHDITEDLSASFKPPSISAAVYTLGRSEFRQHLALIEEAAPKRPAVLTFDDGAASAYFIVARELERAALRGYFFITTNWIERPGFLTAAQIRELAARGHAIGSHSCSHPERMSKLGRAALIEEWTGSRVILEEILGARVTVASVPGGYHSMRVARAAAQCGYRTLFTSEPTSRVREVDGCRVIGRYSIKRGSSAAAAAAVASGRRLPRMRQWIEWNAKKPVKFLGGDLYLTARRLLLSTQCQSF